MSRRILQSIQLDKIAAVDKPCQEHAIVTIMKRNEEVEKVDLDLDSLRDKIVKQALDGTLDCDAWGAAKKQLQPAVQALKYSLDSIHADASLDEAGCIEQINKSVGQFLQLVQKRFTVVEAAMIAEAVAEQRFANLRKQALLAKTGMALAKLNMAKNEAAALASSPVSGADRPPTQQGIVHQDPRRAGKSRKLNKAWTDAARQAAAQTRRLRGLKGKLRDKLEAMPGRVEAAGARGGGRVGAKIGEKVGTGIGRATGRLAGSVFRPRTARRLALLGTAASVYNYLTSHHAPEPKPEEKKAVSKQRQRDPFPEDTGPRRNDQSQTSGADAQMARTGPRGLAGGERKLLLVPGQQKRRLMKSRDAEARKVMNRGKSAKRVGVGPPSMSDHGINKAWSDKARQAAAEARRRKAGSGASSASPSTSTASSGGGHPWLGAALGGAAALGAGLLGARFGGRALARFGSKAGRTASAGRAAAAAPKPHPPGYHVPKPGDMPGVVGEGGRIKPHQPSAKPSGQAAGRGIGRGDQFRRGHSVGRRTSDHRLGQTLNPHAPGSSAHAEWHRGFYQGHHSRGPSVQRDSSGRVTRGWITAKRAKLLKTWSDVARQHALEARRAAAQHRQAATSLRARAEGGASGRVLLGSTDRASGPSQHQQRIARMREAADAHDAAANHYENSAKNMLGGSGEGTILAHWRSLRAQHHAYQALQHERRARQLGKRDQRVQKLVKNIGNIIDITELLKKLPKDAGAADYIHDFTRSSAPQFRGKSKKERIRQALGAYYAANR